MRIKKGLFITEIEIEPGEFTKFAYAEKPPMFVGLMRWLNKYCDFRPIVKEEATETATKSNKNASATPGKKKKGL